MRFKHCISALACIAVLLLAVPKAFFMPAEGRLGHAPAGGAYAGDIFYKERQPLHLPRQR